MEGTIASTVARITDSALATLLEHTYYGILVGKCILGPADERPGLLASAIRRG